FRSSRRFPSRNATAIPTTKRLWAKGSTHQLTNEIPAASSQYVAGAAKGKRLRAKIGETTTAIRARANPNEGASGELRPTTTSDMASIARSAISTSNQYVRANLMSVNVLERRAGCLLPR